MFRACEQNKTCWKWLQCVLLTAIILILIDTVLSNWLSKTHLLFQSFNTETPEILLDKITALNQVKSGQKVVIVGNSLVVGDRIAQQDKQWRTHTFDQTLTRHLNYADTSASNLVYIANAGMNGATMSDIEQIAGTVVQSQHIDLLLLAVNLQPFSMSFSASDKQYRHEWTKKLAEVNYNLFTPPAPGLKDYSQLNLMMHQFVMGHWSFYANRDILQQFVLRDNPGVRIRNLWYKLNDHFLKKAGNEKQEKFITKLHEEYATLRFDSENTQIRAFERLMSLLKVHHQKTIIFYVSEDPTVLDAIMPSSQYQAALARLKALIQSYQSDEIVYLETPTAFAAHFPKNGYFDPIHLNAVGEEYFSKQILLPTVSQMLLKNKD